MSTTTHTTHAERGAAGGRARAETLSPDRRREIGQRGHLAGAVGTIVRRVGELTGDQRERLARALRGDAE